MIFRVSGIANWASDNRDGNLADKASNPTRTPCCSYFTSTICPKNLGHHGLIRTAMALSSLSNLVIIDVSEL